MFTFNQGLRTDGSSIFEYLRNDSEAWCLLGRHGRLGLHIPTSYVSRWQKYTTDFKNISSTKAFEEAVGEQDKVGLTRALLYIAGAIQSRAHSFTTILLVSGVESKEDLTDLFRRRLSYEKSTPAFAKAMFILPMDTVDDSDVEFFKSFNFPTSTVTVEQLEANRKAAVAARPKRAKKDEAEALTTSFAVKLQGGESASLRTVLETPESVIIFCFNEFKSMWKTPELKSPLLEKVGEVVGRTVTEDDLWFTTASANEIKAKEWEMLAETGRVWYVENLYGTNSKALREFKDNRRMKYEDAVFEGFKSLRPDFAMLYLNHTWSNVIGLTLLKRLGWFNGEVKWPNDFKRTTIDLLAVGLEKHDPYALAVDTMNKALYEDESLYSFIRIVPRHEMNDADVEIRDYALGRLEEMLRDKGCGKD